MAIKKSNKDEGNELAELLISLGSNWPVVLIICLFTTLGGIIVAEYIRPVYEVNALLQVESKSKGVNGLTGDLSSLFSNSSPTETEIELVKSRRVGNIVIEALGLHYEVVPVGFLNRIFQKSARLELDSLEIPRAIIEDADDKSLPWVVVATDSSHYSFYDFKDSLLLENAELKETYEISYTTTLGNAPVKIAVKRMNAVAGQKFEVRRYLKQQAFAAFNSAFDVKEKGKRTGILEFTYEDFYADRAAKILNEIAFAYQRNNVAQRSLEAQSTIQFLENQLPIVKNRLDSSEQVLNQYRSQVGSADIKEEAKIVLEKQMKLQQQLLDLEQKRQETVRLFHEEHPTVKTLDERISKIKGELSKAFSQVKKMPETQQEVLRLSSDVEINKLLYTNMLNNIQQLKLVAAGEVGSVRIIDEAEPTLGPKKPKKKMFYVMGFFLGICFSVGFISLKNKMKSGIKDSRTIERELGISVYAKIPKGVPTKNTGHLPLAVASPDDLAVEAMRTLRTSLEFMMPETGSSVIAVSGLIPGVGKSFVSVNLAALFASVGKKVIIIDADLRKGRLHKEFGFSKDNGLSEVLMGKTSLDNAIKETSVPGLSLMVCGKIPSTPAELLGSRKYENLIAALREKYDIILVDTPPVMLVTDAMYVCRHTDQAIMVVEYNRHALDAIKEAVELFTKGAKDSLHTSIVINKYVHRKSDGYGYKYGKY